MITGCDKGEKVLVQSQVPGEIFDCQSSKGTNKLCRHAILDEVKYMLLLLSCFSLVRLCDPIDSSPPGSPVPGILQARTLEWVAISFSSSWKWKVRVKTLSPVQLFEAPWTAAHQAPPSMGFWRQEYWSGLPLPSPVKYIHTQYSTFPKTIFFYSIKP